MAIRFVAAVFVLVFLLSPAAHALTCGDVLRDMKPCIEYLKSGSGTPPKPCCDGAKSLASAATSTADKQTACTCLKNASNNMKVQPALAKALPSNCGISLPFEVSPSVDCTKIS